MSGLRGGRHQQHQQQTEAQEIKLKPSFFSEEFFKADLSSCTRNNILTRNKYDFKQSYVA